MDLNVLRRLKSMAIDVVSSDIHNVGCEVQPCLYFLSLEKKQEREGGGGRSVNTKTFNAPEYFFLVTRRSLDKLVVMNLRGVVVPDSSPPTIQLASNLRVCHCSSLKRSIKSLSLSLTLVYRRSGVSRHAGVLL